MSKYILALDQGTTSSRAIVFDHFGKIVSSDQKEFTQVFPKPGWVEHNPIEIWKTQKQVAISAIKKAGIDAGKISSIGITNQRETTVLWERDTGKPAHNAIVWQCRRTTELCKKLKKKGYEKVVRKKTGLLIDPYFSGTKIMWMMEHVPGLSERARRGDICFGTIDSWLLFNLTGEHITEPTNASRTLLFNINTGKWDKDLLNIFGVSSSMLPSIAPSSGCFAMTKKKIFGRSIPVGGIAGDQQAALFGQACFKKGDTKNTYGTGCFVLMNTGKTPILSKNKLLTTVAWDIGDGLEYALEGAVFIGGAVVKWLRDQQKTIATAADSETHARSVKSADGVYFVPAFVGLGAPYWDPGARGAIFGLTRGTSRKHITRAALESIAFQSYDLIKAQEEDIGHKVKSLKVDGGASVNSFLMQFQADILGIPVISSAIPETTALGAAYLAGLSCGYWKSKKDIVNNWHMRKTFKPEFDAEKRARRLSGWKHAVAATMKFKPGG
ncbi:MAG: glycerol kinase GlpK [Candidatus Omnitrophica bacterium]|nr:glycerol kinase GlpK [Candidatus Omnitrophota bacterium]MBU1127790.1 glycerol kinase GlpK [Candidatus Omnitrophota bacterium]MBU1656691.1 glycerol kinase GlpK [Candidatus Omnitrophota bacterium]MBU1784651.1 glycerol kinase GlpK [Candidatus Omnitrophota bacterium]MBU1852263.1 glycerol kinase GlpK [Candidatus Omnitrophota bacterium]